MDDTDPDLQLRFEAYHRGLTPAQRMEIASAMFDTARAIVDSSLPVDLSPHERRVAIARRFYAGELPESAFTTFARYRRGLS